MDQKELRAKTIAKLKELFQLDQPDLDFGFYRVMHVKAKEISEFIERDLLKTIQTAFDTVSAEKASGELESVRNSVLTTLGEEALDSDGALKTEYRSTPVGKKYLKAYQNAGSSKTKLIGADQVYNHLYRFFSRYYDSGDFVSMRYHTRETASVARPYAIPYGGEEVMLYWANADQYYIKTSENFRDFTFDPAAAPEIQNLPEDQRNLILGTASPGQYKVHFTIVDADQGEHGNIKSADDSKREFFLANDPVCYENGELVVRFEYRTPGEGDAISEVREKQLQERFGFSKKSNHGLYNIAAEILDALAADSAIPKEYQNLLNVSAPTESVKKRPLLAKYLYRYTAANKSDYFIHKNLRAFLRRELDFYIKNEIMNLDDVVNMDVSGLENQLDLIKVFRKIAGKLIDFLGQLEDFQKRLWLKKKFVVECNYCITLDRIRKVRDDDDEWRRSQRDRLMTEIFSNERQIAEWERLGFDVSRVKLGGGGGPGSSQSEQLALDDMDSATPDPNDYLMVDTQFFPPEFKSRLLSFIPDFDAQCDGLLIHSDNFQALNLIHARYREQVKCIFIDPPYNAKTSEILYKNDYKHSSWLSLIQNVIDIGKQFLLPTGIQCTTIDDVEQCKLSLLLAVIFGRFPYTVAVRIKPSGRPIPNGFAISHEYALFNKCDESVPITRMYRDEEQISRYRENDQKGPFFWEMLRKAGSNSFKEDRPTMHYPICWNQSTNVFRIPLMHFDTNIQEYVLDEIISNDETILYPLKDNGVAGRWYFGLDYIREHIDEIKAEKQKNNIYYVYYKRRPNEGVQPTTFWESSKYSATEHGTALLKSLFGIQDAFNYPKSIHAIVDYLKVSGCNPDSLVFDYFAGSGTTAHAVINLNREDGGNRKYILVEMGDHFNTVLKPRIEKVVYSPDWKDGKPTSFDKGVSHCFKYIRLESYEDTLNNLELPESDPIESSMPPSLREDYMLHYLLDTEANASLLDIDMFKNPFGGYRLKIKRPGSEACDETPVDLIETFNYLIGLRVSQYYLPRRYSARFKRAVDPELPGEEGSRRLVLDGRPKLDDAGKWSFLRLEGVVPAHPLNPNNGQTKRVLVIWRNLTGDMEQDNAVLDWFADDLRLNDKVPEYDIVYVNGCNNLGADRKETDSYQVRLIEEEFFRKMWG